MHTQAVVAPGQRVGSVATGLIRLGWSILMVGVLIAFAAGPLLWLFPVHTIFSLAFLGLVFWQRRTNKQISAKSVTALAFCRSAMDIFTVSTVVLITGGMQSAATIGVAIPVGLSSLSEDRSRGFFAALLAVGLIATGELAMTLGWTPDLNIWGGPTPTSLSLLAILLPLWVAALLGLSFAIQRIYARAMVSQGEAEKARRAGARLNEFFAEISHLEDMHEVMQRIMNYFAEVFGFLHDYSLYLVDESGEYIHCWSIVFPRNVSSEARQKIIQTPIPIKVNGGIFAAAYRRGAKPTYFARVRPGGLEEERFVISAYNLKDFLILPIVESGKTIAFLNLGSGSQGALSAADIAKISEFRNQISGFIQTQQALFRLERSRRQAEQTAEESAFLADLARKANAATDFSRLLSLVGQMVSERFAAQTAAFYLVQGSSLQIVSFMREGQAEDPAILPPLIQNIRLEKSSGTLFRTYQKKEPLHLRRVSAEWLAKKGSAIDRAIHSVLPFSWFVQLPLISEDQVVGIFTFSGPRGRRLTGQDLNFLERMGAQVAGAVRTAKLLLDLGEARSIAERDHRMIEKLNEFSKELNSHSDFNVIYEKVAKYLESEYGIDSSILLLPDEGSNLLTAAFHSGARVTTDMLAFSRDLRIPKNHGGMMRRTFDRGKALFIRNTARDLFQVDYPGRELDRMIIDQLELKWFLALPLIIQKQPIGLLLTTSYERETRPDPGTVTAIKRFAAQIAGGIYTSNLLQAVSKERDRARQERLSAEEARREADDARRISEQLASVSRQVNATTDLSQVAQHLFAFMKENYALEKMALILVSDNRQYLYLVNYDHLSLNPGEEHWARNFRPPLSPEGGSLFRTYQTQKPLYLKRIPEVELGPVDQDIIRALNLKSFVHLPLIAGGETIGIIFGARSEQAEPLRRRQIQELQNFADQVAGAVRTAQFLRQVETARAESDKLLYNILPAPVAEELKREGRVEPLFYDAVTVIFTDFVGFTKASEKMMPHQLVEELDGCFSQFDEIAKRYQIEKLKTIGDSYMGVAGVPLLRNSHAIDACLAALEIRSFMLQMAEVKKALELDFWQIRIGLHSGPVTGGVIGNYKFAYDIWGDTVNLASRMESAGEPDRVNLSQVTYELINDFFDCEHRGKIQAKGKGDLDMYFLLRIKPELSADSEGLVPGPSFEAKRRALEEFAGFERQ